MAARQPCLVCFRDTKYACLTCSLPVCNICATAENDESTTGWKDGRKVGYCPGCAKNSEVEETDEVRPNKKQKWYVFIVTSTSLD